MNDKQQDIFQTNLFGEIKPLDISIDEAASEAGVSIATIRNWIKTGYLTQTKKGMIAKDSLIYFMEEIAGKEKLNARANKLLKDSHNHDALTITVNKKILNSHISADFLGDEYEKLLSESHKNKEGIYYTPMSIINDMLIGIKEDLSTKLFCDPCCGGGNFIMCAIEAGFKPENVYGFDTDPNAVAITKKRIFDKTDYKTENIIEGDFLEKASLGGLSYDYIYTNPPWGKKLPKEIKESYSVVFNSGKSLDTSSLFFFASLSCLKEGGYLGFLLPESFFNISTFQDVRNKALSLKINRLIDYDKPFKSLVTRAQAIILSKVKTENKEYSIACEYGGKLFMRSGKSFLSNPKTIMNFWLHEDASQVINHIFTIPHVTLENNADWGLGIVTGNNSKFCKSVPTEGYMPVYKGSDIQNNNLKEPSNFIPSDLSLYQQVAPKHLYKAKEKLIYKFITSKLSFFCDTEKRYILNSANMLVLKNGFPITSRQLCDLLNSEFINWFFQSIFNTHKILRGDLEIIPIHVGYFEVYTIFNEREFLNYLNIEKITDGTYRIKR